MGGGTPWLAIPFEVRSTMRVLVVENDHDTADSLAILLRLTHCEVRVCYDGYSALETAAGFCPHLMLVDLGMPGMNGLEFAREVRKRAELDNTLLAALTGYADMEHRNLAAAAGFDEYLVKPVPLPALTAFLQRVRTLGTPAREAV